VDLPGGVSHAGGAAVSSRVELFRSLDSSRGGERREAERPSTCREYRKFGLVFKK